MYGPGTNLSTEDTAVNNREKKKTNLCSHLNVSGGGSISLNLKYVSNNKCFFFRVMMIKSRLCFTLMKYVKISSRI